MREAWPDDDKKCAEVLLRNKAEKPIERFSKPLQKEARQILQKLGKLKEYETEKEDTSSEEEEDEAEDESASASVHDPSQNDDICDICKKLVCIFPSLLLSYCCYSIAAIPSLIFCFVAGACTGGTRLLRDMSS